MADIEVQKHSVHTLVFRSLKRTHDMFLSDKDNTASHDDESERLRIAVKLRDEYGLLKDRGQEREKKRMSATGQLSIAYPEQDQWQAGQSMEMGGTHPYPSGPGIGLDAETARLTYPGSGMGLEAGERKSQTAAGVHDIIQHAGNPERYAAPGSNKTLVSIGDQKMLVPKKAPTMPKPQWHPPWKLFRVISGHLGWVRCVDIEPGNEWFATGSADRIIKIWDLASGTLKLSLTGHISTVRGVAVSPRHPFLFSCGEDKQVKCWDLEYNKVIRHYHGHLSACYGIDIHPTIDLLMTCSRDATVRVWDMRTKAQVHCLTGHTNTVSEVKCQAAEPQVVTCSHDKTLRLWDLIGGKSRVTLTNHKKSVRSVVLHPTQYSMASASPDNIKQWKFPDGNFLQNLPGHNAIVNTLAINGGNVLVSGGDNGSMHFWDWRSGYNFQRIQATAQPGSIDSECGIFASKFDKSGSRLITCEADKTIKIYKEDDTASEDTHPINWRPEIMKKKRY